MECWIERFPIQLRDEPPHNVLEKSDRNRRLIEWQLKRHCDCRSEGDMRSQFMCKGLRELQSGGRFLQIGEDNVHLERSRSKPRGALLGYRFPRKVCGRLMVSAAH
jgi:hypothetical protein